MSAFRQAACVILLRPNSRGHYDVYLTLRNPRLAFMGGFHAFAGGSVEPTDEALVANQAPGLHADQCARVAALRELFEELGVLAITADTRTHVEQINRQAWRVEVISQPQAFNNGVQKAKLQLATADLIPMGRWRTPPYTPVRFDAVYYALWLPQDEAPSLLDGADGELIDGLWLSCEEALQRHEAGTLFISYPVLETLRVLHAFGSDLAGASRAMEQRGAEPYPHAGGEMLRGVHIVPGKTPTLPPATHTNTYLLGGQDLVVIDPATPYEEEQDALVQYIQHLHAQGAKLKAIWLTHHHHDHVGAVLRIQREFHVPVLAHPLTQQALDSSIHVDSLLHDGSEQTLRIDANYTATWRALHTPGHTRGHLCFYNTQLHTLISGDLILGTGTVLIAPPEGDMSHYMASLRRLEAMPLGFIFPAHGPPVAASHHKIQEYIAHRLMRESAIVEALKNGNQTPAQIVKRVYTDIVPHAYPLAEMNVRAHLDKLVRDGRVTQTDEQFWLQP